MKLKPYSVWFIIHHLGVLTDDCNEHKRRFWFRSSAVNYAHDIKKQYPDQNIHVSKDGSDFLYLRATK